MLPTASVSSPPSSGPPAAGFGTSTTPKPQPPVISSFSPKLFIGSEERKLTEIPLPITTREKSQPKSQHMHEDGLRASNKDSPDFFLSRFFLHVSVEHTEQKQNFYVHAELLKDRTKFFKTEPPMIHTAGFPTVELSNTRPETFAIYVSLLYTNKLRTKGPKEWHWLCRLYILAERLRDIKTKNLTIDGMILYLQETALLFSSTPVAKDGANVDATSLTWLYEHTPKNSPARRLAVDYYAQSGRAEWLLSNKSEYPPQFVFDVAVCMMQKRPCSLFATHKMSSAYYHEDAVTTDKSAATKQEVDAE
ncbi:hypothetical protein EKO04_000464 [Ascochyta lentis]|uniref:BTB domain-containing protein n=1 Tax=Ascochyta lentis TaxID=205686 RepID=A0A8H7MN29_9PLEO|nr:hypothetical protein EKO04_000464 [Ascochyta lentis]